MAKKERFVRDDFGAGPPPMQLGDYRAPKHMSDSLDNREEAFWLLSLVFDAIRDDPKAVQFFDLRMIPRIEQCLRLHKKLIARGDEIPPSEKALHL